MTTETGHPDETGLLLDTCAVVWVADRQPIRPSALHALNAALQREIVFVSPVSAWEIGVLTAPRGARPPRMVLSLEPETWFAAFMAQPGVRSAEFTAGIALHAGALPPGLHDDPGDRLLVATARRLGLRIMTRDRRILEYARQGHVRAVAC